MDRSREHFETVGDEREAKGNKMEEQNVMLNLEGKMDQVREIDEGIGSSILSESRNSEIGSRLDDTPGDNFNKEVEVTSTPMNQAAGNLNRGSGEDINLGVMQMMMKMFEQLNGKLDEQNGKILEGQSEQKRKLDEQKRKLDEQKIFTEEQIRKSTEEQKRFTEEQIGKLAEEQSRKLDEIGGRIGRIEEQMESTKSEMTKIAERVEVHEQWISEEFEKHKKEVESQVISLGGELETKLHQQLDAKTAAQDEKIERMRNQCREEIRTVEEDAKKLQLAVKEEIKENRRECEEKVSILRAEVEQVKECKASPIAAGGTVPFTPPRSLKFSGDGKENPCIFMRAAERHLAVINTSERCKIQFLYLMLEGNARTWADTFDVFPESLKEFKDRFFERYWNEEIQMNFKISLMNNYYNQSMGSLREYATKRIMEYKTLSPPMNDQEIICVLTRQFPVTVQNLLRSVHHTNLERFQNVLGGYDLTFAGAPKNRNEGNVNLIRMERNQGQGSDRGTSNQGNQRGRGGDGWRSEPRNQRPEWSGSNPNRTETRGGGGSTPNQPAQPSTSREQEHYLNQ